MYFSYKSADSIQSKAVPLLLQEVVLCALNVKTKNYYYYSQSFLNIHTGQSCLVGCTYPGVGAPWNVVCSQNLARLHSTCYNNYRWRGFNSDRRQLQVGSRPVNFDDTYESGFLPVLRSLNLNGTFVCEDGVGWFPCIQCLSWHCSNYLSSTLLDRCKIQGHPGSNHVP